MHFSFIGAKVCEYFEGNYYSNKDVRFSPNRDHWPAASVNTKEGCRKLCQSLDNCPQADFPKEIKSCWLYRSDIEWDRKIRRPHDDYIICEKG